MKEIASPCQFVNVNSQFYKSLKLKNWQGDAFSMTMNFSDEFLNN